MPASTVEVEKRIAAEKAVEFVETIWFLAWAGSTIAFVLEALARRVKEGLRIRIPTSEAATKLARELGIELTDFEYNTVCDLAIDGADEVNGKLDLIKGGGGALLREKIVTSSASKFIVIVDSHKVVEKLGKFRVPIEVIQFASPLVQRKVANLGGDGQLRLLLAVSPSSPMKVTTYSTVILD